MQIIKYTLVAGIGGFFGTSLRFCSEKLVALMFSGVFPLGTFMANMVGCFLIGLFYGMMNNSKKYGKNFDLFWITGFCGGFTTFSSFSEEMTRMFESGYSFISWTYMIGSIILGLILVIIGIACAGKAANCQTLPKTQES